MTYDEIKRFDVGMKIHPRFQRQEKIEVSKPRLADLIDSVEAYCQTRNLIAPQYNIETKSLPETDGKYHPAPNEFVDLVIEVMRSKGIQERGTLQSFDFRTLQYVRQKYPSVKTAMLIEDSDKRSLQQQLKDLGFTPTIYSPEYSLVNPSLIEKCHEMKMKIVPWTVNDKPTIERLREMGVDGIITDYPDLFK
jgi:glycerophosphoryl diester phosphodiesterase